MAKKMDEAEVKKECPSCGLGVALDSTICEFCGWDFEEEDEWILQIEKLERDLMLEKQKFEPGSFNDKIEATLHDPAKEMKAIKSAQRTEEATKAPQAQARLLPPPKQASRPAPTPQPVVREAPRPQPAAKPAPSPKPAQPQPAPVAKQAPEQQKVRRVRTVRGSTSESESEAGGFVTRTKPAEEPPPEAPTKKVRLVRKIK
jgi:hypothetical protein